MKELRRLCDGRDAAKPPKLHGPLKRHFVTVIVMANVTGSVMARGLL